MIHSSRTVVYFFTGTGNSLSIARRLAMLLQDGEDPATEIVPIARRVAEARRSGGSIDARDHDRVVIVFPVYIWGPPRIVKAFARRLRVRPGAYLCAVADAGGEAGSTLGILRRSLRRRGSKLTAGYSVRAVNNYLPLDSMFKEDPETVQAAMGPSADRVAHAIRDEWAGIEYTAGVAQRALLSGMVRSAAYPFVALMGRRFRATDACNGCGVCARVCPVGNIELRASPGSPARPHWRWHCQQCWACLHWCPQGAVEWMLGTRGKPRYHHRSVTIRDMEGQADLPDAAHGGTNV